MMRVVVIVVHAQISIESNSNRQGVPIDDKGGDGGRGEEESFYYV